LEDGDLEHFLEKNEFEDQEKMLRQVMFGIISGMACIHSAGVLHRDLRLLNVLVSRKSGEIDAKICDFGMGRGYNRKNLNMTSLSIVSVKEYSAPEGLLSPCYTYAVDVWAVGCIMASIVNNRENIFHIETHRPEDQLIKIIQIIDVDREQLKKLTEGDPTQKKILAATQETSLEEMFPQLSGDALDLMRQLLRFDPNERITMKEALEHPFLEEIACRRTSNNYADIIFETDEIENVEGRRQIADAVWNQRDKLMQSLQEKKQKSTE